MSDQLEPLVQSGFTQSRDTETRPAQQERRKGVAGYKHDKKKKRNETKQSLHSQTEPNLPHGSFNKSFENNKQNIMIMKVASLQCIGKTAFFQWPLQVLQQKPYAHKKHSFLRLQHNFK